MYINLSGLHVILTGATHSLGKAIAAKLGEAGATLALQYHSKGTQAEELAYTLSNNSRAFQVDLSNRKQRTTFVDKVLGEYGEVEVLINNASQYTPSALSLPEEKWLESWQKNFALNFESVSYLSKRVVDFWRKKKITGRIINISILPPTITSSGEELAYTTSKAAMEAFTCGLSQAVFSSRIKTFTLLPPPFRSEQHLRFSKENNREQVNLPKPRDIAPVVAFLCSGLADSASGTVIDMSKARLQLGQVAEESNTS